jgi:prepilin peptidase CpaA
MDHAITSPSGSFDIPRHVSGSRGSLVAPAVVAGGVVACFLWTVGEEPLPSIGWAAAFLLLAICEDVSRLRIPNWLTLPSLALALGVAASVDGGIGLKAASAGVGVAFACTFVPFLVRWLGAGDVKACLVLGALWGAENFLGVLFWMLLSGGVLAIALLAARGGLGDLIARWFASARLTVTSGRITYLAPAECSPARAGVPFAVAMGLGACAFQLWGSSW